MDDGRYSHHDRSCDGSLGTSLLTTVGVQMNDAAGGGDVPGESSTVQYGRGWHSPVKPHATMLGLGGFSAGAFSVILADCMCCTVYCVRWNDT